jgi:hypothetical protein
LRRHAPGGLAMHCCTDPSGDGELRWKVRKRQPDASGMRTGAPSCAPVSC